MTTNEIPTCQVRALHEDQVRRARASALPDDDVAGVAGLFKVLGDPTRTRILRALRSGELCVCDIMRALGITQSKASRHLRYLFNVGLVSDRREGAWMYYRMAVPPESDQEKLIQLLGEMLAGTPEAEKLREKLKNWLEAKAAATEEVSCVC